MSESTVDDLHCAEDRIGVLTAELRRVAALVPVADPGEFCRCRMPDEPGPDGEWEDICVGDDGDPDDDTCGSQCHHHGYTREPWPSHAEHERRLAEHLWRGLDAARHAGRSMDRSGASHRFGGAYETAAEFMGYGPELHAMLIEVYDRVRAANFAMAGTGALPAELADHMTDAIAIGLATLREA